jgi:hypothetical protein
MRCSEREGCGRTVDGDRIMETGNRNTSRALVNIQNVLRGKMNILGAHSIGHSQRKVYVYVS